MNKIGSCDVIDASLTFYVQNMAFSAVEQQIAQSNKVGYQKDKHQKIIQVKIDDLIANGYRNAIINRIIFICNDFLNTNSISSFDSPEMSLLKDRISKDTEIQESTKSLAQVVTVSLNFSPSASVNNNNGSEGCVIQ